MAWHAVMARSMTLRLARLHQPLINAAAARGGFSPLSSFPQRRAFHATAHRSVRQIDASNRPGATYDDILPPLRPGHERWMVPLIADLAEQTCQGFAEEVETHINRPERILATVPEADLHAGKHPAAFFEIDMVAIANFGGKPPSYQVLFDYPAALDPGLHAFKLWNETYGYVNLTLNLVFRFGKLLRYNGSHEQLWKVTLRPSLGWKMVRRLAREVEEHVNRQGKSAARGGASEWKDVGVYMDLLNTEDGEATRHVFIFNLPKEIDPRLELLLEGREEVEAYGPWKGGWSHEP